MVHLCLSSNLPLGAFNKESLELVRFSALEGPGQGGPSRQLLLLDELLPQLHRALPLLLGGVPAKPHPDAKRPGRDQESIFTVEVVFGEIPLLQLLSLHCPSDVTDPINKWFERRIFLNFSSPLTWTAQWSCQHSQWWRHRSQCPCPGCLPSRRGASARSTPRRSQPPRRRPPSGWSPLLRGPAACNDHPD